MFGWFQLGLGAACVLGLLWLGDQYGFRSHKLARYEAADAARNAALDYQSAHETQVGAIEDAEHSTEDQQFKLLTRGLEQCVLTEAQAAALNVVRE